MSKIIIELDKEDAEKVLETCGQIVVLLDSQKKAVKKAMRREHDAGPEANYIFKLWREINE